MGVSGGFASPSLLSSSVEQEQQYGYDVFLSFRGEDTRLGFTSYLAKALCDRGISTFFDDYEGVKRGIGGGGEEEEEISIKPSDSLMKAIKDSKIAIVIFSENYGSSSWCLDELVCILENKDRPVFPVFYKVDPSDVGQQKGIFGDAYNKNFNSMANSNNSALKLKKWKIALSEAATLSGWHFKHGDGSYEYELIDRIVDSVSAKIDSSPLRVADHLVGLNYRVLEVNWLLNDAARSHDGVNMIGIWGMAGLGKTTLARAIYNSLASKFEALCFLENVRENSMKHGSVHLQQILLRRLAGEKEPQQLTRLNRGTLQLKDMLLHKKVFIVLDDVDHLDQLLVTVGSAKGPGSTVIITTRDEQLLKTYGVDKTYKVEKLAKDEALELLCWKAFKAGKIFPRYIDLVTRAASYASGLPLALEVIGSNLYGKEIDEWESALESYKIFHHNKDILMILKLSFDALGEEEKQVFLDIACFFKGYELSELEYLLGAHRGYSLEYHIGALVDKSLIKIDEHNRIEMHDLIQEMGRNIIQQESPEHPGRRSRLWSTEDIVQVLEEDTGTSEIQMVVLDFPKSERVVKWDGEAFKKMKGLRTLIIRSHCFSDGPKDLPNSLRVLEWWGYPSHSLPHFNPEKLVVLKLPHSCFMSVELSMSKKFLNMRQMNFDKCEFITHIPDVSGAPNLEELSLASCGNLLKIHESLGFLDKLKSVNVEGCHKLWTFPPINSRALEYLNLSHCSSLVSFPEILGIMKNIKQLTLEYTAIRELPHSIGNLSQLRRLAMHSCGMLQLPSSIVQLQKLEELSIWQCEGLQSTKQDRGLEKFSSMVSSNAKHIDFLSCNISDEFIQIGLAWFANVEELNLSMNNFTILPASITKCRRLTKLNLDYCRHLREIRGIPPNLETFSARRCTSLKDLDLTVLLASTKERCALRELILDDCENLHEIRGIPPNIELLSARNCGSLTSSCRRMLLNQELHEAGNKRFCLPGTQIPDWFEQRNRGHSISFWFRDKFPAISLCLVELMHMLPIRSRLIVIINGNKMRTELQTKQWFGFEFPLLTDHLLIVGERQLNFVDNMDEVLLVNKWNHAMISIDVDSEWNPTERFVVGTGIHVIEQKSSMDSIRFTDPCNQQYFKGMVFIGGHGSFL